MDFANILAELKRRANELLAKLPLNRRQNALVNTEAPNQMPVPPSRPNNQQGWNRYYSTWVWKGFAVLIGIGLLMFIAVSMGLFGRLPSFFDLESPQNALASEVYANDGSLLGKFFVEDRTNTNFEELPPHLIDALVTTEDVRFFEHSGIDYEGTFRVIFKTLLMGQNTGGGSTITQQLAKNLFHERPESTFERAKQKVKEWIIAIKLERSYTKEEIINMYFNTVPFSNNAYGIKSASRVYFNTTPNSLNVQQAAVLVGMLKGSTLYNPQRNPQRSLERRNVVLSQMGKYGKLSAAQVDSLQKTELGVSRKTVIEDSKNSSYFLEYIKTEVKKWAKSNVKVDGENYDLYRDGLKIYTTLNPKMQKYAEESVDKHMQDLQKQFNAHWKGKEPWDHLPKAAIPASDPWYGTNELLHRAVKNSERYATMKSMGLSEFDIHKAFLTPVEMRLFAWHRPDHTIDTTLAPFDSIKYTKHLLHTGFLATDPTTGYVLAWAGGIDFDHFKYDNIRPSSKRQVGSTFKPLMYTVAVQNGWSPCRTVPNLPIVFEEYENWSPENASGVLSGQMVSLKTGLAYSINRVTAYLMKQIGPQPLIDLSRRMGIDSPMKPVPSICLGSTDVSVYEMVGAYGTYANRGFYAKPMAMLRIEDKNGNVIQNFTTTKAEVINEQVSYAMINMLKGVIDFGTARRLRGKYGLRAEIAGKTGTTNENSDGWFIGMVPKLCAGAWVGGDEKSIHFRTTELGSGSNMSLPIWGEFMTRVYRDKSLGITENDRFVRPAEMGIQIDCYQYSGITRTPTGSPTDTTQGGQPTPDSTKQEFDYNNQFD